MGKIHCDAVLILSVVSMALALTGNVMVNYRLRYGFVVWIASNISWIGVNFVQERPNYPMVFMYLVYMALNVQGFVHWGTLQ
ncbi:MAG: nicotinamide mononucleotide transporter [Clostridia bacterium]|nr:nicotinamide mononucleotide transporter [Clostridia bacterium]